MLYVRLVNPFKSIALDKLADAAETGLHVGRQGFELISNAIVEQLYDPCLSFILLHFCNVGRHNAMSLSQGYAIDTERFRPGWRLSRSSTAKWFSHSR